MHKNAKDQVIFYDCEAEMHLAKFSSKSMSPGTLNLKEFRQFYLESVDSVKKQ